MGVTKYPPELIEKWKTDLAQGKTDKDALVLRYGIRMNNLNRMLKAGD